MPADTASKATLAGSAWSLSERMTCAPTRSPQVCSWSAAAARKVSAAPSTTVCPSPTSDLASLPQVVVLPVPLTPTTSTTAGRPSCRWVRSARLAEVSTWASSSVLSISRTSSVVRVPSTLTLVRRSAVICRAGVTPTSAVISTSSSSSQVSSSSRSRDSRASRALPKPLCDRASRARSRTIRPAEGGGFSRAGRGGAAGSGGAWRCCGGAGAVAVAVPVRRGRVVDVWAWSRSGRAREPGRGGPRACPAAAAASCRRRRAAARRRPR